MEGAGGGVGEEVDAWVSEDLAAEGLGEVAAGKGSPFREAEAEAGGEGDFGVVEGGEEVVGEGERGNVEEGFDLGVEGLEGGGGEGPGGEDLGGVGEELAAPAGGQAAEGADKDAVGVGVGGDVLAEGGVGVGGLGGVEAAGFNKGDLMAEDGEAGGENEAGDAGAEDEKRGGRGGGLAGQTGRGEVEIEVHAGRALLPFRVRFSGLFSPFPWYTETTEKGSKVLI